MPPQPKPGILDIAAYVPGKRSAAGFADPIKLSSNENALGCSNAARAAYLAGQGRLHLYPDGRANILREAIAEHFGLEEDRLVFGAGSDEIFSLLAQVYLQPGDNVVQPRFGFMSYRIVGKSAGAEVRFAPEQNFRVDVDALLALVDERTRIVFVANPGNPTGTWIDSADVRRMHAGLPDKVILVLDGAYAEFVSDGAYEDGLAMALKAENIVVTRTFSKLHGLAALRIGWGYGPQAIVDAIDRIRPAFNTSVPGQECAVAALQDFDFQRLTLELVGRERAYLQMRLEACGLEVAPSRTNFLMVRFPAGAEHSASEVEAYLMSRGILVRGLAGYGLKDCLRITVGNEAQNRALVQTLSELRLGVPVQA